MNYVLDTNIFNRVLDGKFLMSSLPKGSAFVATKIQLEELKKTTDIGRRSELLKTFEDIYPNVMPASFAFDIPGAGIDEGAWSQNDNAIKLRADLEAMKKSFNNWSDALIADVALTHQYWLVTADKNLAQVAKNHRISVYFVD